MKQMMFITAAIALLALPACGISIGSTTHQSSAKRIQTLERRVRLVEAQLGIESPTPAAEPMDDEAEEGTEQ